MSNDLIMVRKRCTVRCESTTRSWFSSDRLSSASMLSKRYCRAASGVSSSCEASAMNLRSFVNEA